MNSSWLQYLPANFRIRDDSGFLSDYLKIFEKILTGLDDEQLQGRKGIQQLLSSEVIGNLFYPRLSFLYPDNHQDFIPPLSALPDKQKTALLAEFNRYIGIGDTPDPLSAFVASKRQTLSWQAQFETWLSEFLRWLGAWVDLVVDEQWSIDKKRKVVAQILALYRLRGTAFGLNSLLNVLLDLPLLLEGLAYQGNQQTTINGRVSLDVSSPNTPGIKVMNSKEDAFVVRDTYQPGMPVVAGFAPGVFVVTVVLPDVENSAYIMTTEGSQIVRTLLKKVNRLTEKLKPACTRFILKLNPGIPINTQGHGANLGNNTLLGS